MKLTRSFKGEVITFYSYKGGTGRTMALANVACILAEKIAGESKVLMIDWDLDAPGLHRFFNNSLKRQYTTLKDSDSLIDKRPGLMDLFWEIDKKTKNKKYQSEENAEELFKEIKINRFIMETDIPGLHLLKAGCFDDNYSLRTNTFQWERLYNNTPWLIQSLADYLKKQYRYVLIDSRTGITDIGGICTILMPDKLITVFTPNNQSLEGVIKLIKQATSYRKRSNDSRPLMIFPLVSRVEAIEPVLSKRWRFGSIENKVAGYQPLFEDAFKEAYGLKECDLNDYFNEVQVQHVPHYAFGEEIAVLAEESQDNLSLSRSYKNFTARMTCNKNPWESFTNHEINDNLNIPASRKGPLSGKEVAATFQISWNSASQEAREVLQVMSFLAPAPVPRRLLRKILSFRFDTLQEDPLDDAITELAKKSIVELDEENDPSAHKLMMRFANSTTGEDSRLSERVFKAVLAEMRRSRDNSDMAALGELEKITPHADILLGSELNDLKDKIELSNDLSWYYFKSGRYRLSEHYGRLSLDFADKKYEPGHPSIATRQSNLAMVLQDLGELEEARDLFGKALASAEKGLEPGHPSIATRQSNLAMVLKDLGELEEARDLLRKALASDEKGLEPEHPAIARSQSNLALVLKDLGELGEARDLLRKALASAEKGLNPGHPSIATRQSGLAMVLKDLGELEEARDLLRKALASDEKAFEPGHPSIAMSQSNLALVLKDLGELEEARDLLRKALASDIKNFDPGHPSIAISQSNLALVLKDLGELEEARDLLRKALASDIKNFDPGHPSIATRQSNLALVLKDLGEIEEARDLARLAYETFLAKFGPQHPNTITTKTNWESI